MALNNCIESTKNLNDEDVSAVLAAYESYKEAGVPEKNAVTEAISDVIESVKAEKAEYIALVEAAYPVAEPEMSQEEAEAALGIPPEQKVGDIESIPESEVKAHVEWRDLGTKNKIKTVTLMFDGMNYGELTKEAGFEWMFEDALHDSLKEAKAAAMAAAISRLQNDGYVTKAETVESGYEKVASKLNDVQKAGLDHIVSIINENYASMPEYAGQRKEQIARAFASVVTDTDYPNTMEGADGNAYDNATSLTHNFVRDNPDHGAEAAPDMFGDEAEAAPAVPQNLIDAAKIIIADYRGPDSDIIGMGMVGPAHADARRKAMVAITGGNVPKAKAGITALKAALIKASGVNTAQHGAGEAADLSKWLIDVAAGKVADKAKPTAPAAEKVDRSEQAHKAKSLTELNEIWEAEKADTDEDMMRSDELMMDIGRRMETLVENAGDSRTMQRIIGEFFRMDKTLADTTGGDLELQWRLDDIKSEEAREAAKDGGQTELAALHEQLLRNASTIESSIVGKADDNEAGRAELEKDRDYQALQKEIDEVADKAERETETEPEPTEEQKELAKTVDRYYKEKNAPDWMNVSHAQRSAYSRVTSAIKDRPVLVDLSDTKKFKVRDLRDIANELGIDSTGLRADVEARIADFYGERGEDFLPAVPEGYIYNQVESVSYSVGTDVEGNQNRKFMVDAYRRVPPDEDGMDIRPLKQKEDSLDISRMNTLSAMFGGSVWKKNKVAGKGWFFDSENDANAFYNYLDRSQKWFDYLGEPEAVYSAEDRTMPDHAETMADDVLAKAKRAVNRMRIYGETILANSVARDFKDQSMTKLLGKQVGTIEEIAELAQIYRNPNLETFRIFYMKGNEVVHQTGATMRLPGETSKFAAGEDYNTMRETMKRVGADGFYMQHNHPTGDPTASAPDKAVTIEMASQVEGFLGHVIIDHTQFNVINAKGESQNHDLSEAAKDIQTYNKDSKPLVDNPWIGTMMRNQSILAFMTMRVQSDNTKTMQMIGIGSKDAGLTGIMDIPVAAFDNRLKFAAQVRSFMRNTASRNVYLVNMPADINAARVNNFIRTDLFRDATYRDGHSFVDETGAVWDGDKFIAGKRRTAGMGLTVAETEAKPASKTVQNRFKLIASGKLKALVKKHTGSAWAREVQKHAVVRSDIEKLASGEITKSRAKFLPDGAMKDILAKKGWDGAWEYLDTHDVIGNAEKPSGAVNSSLTNCNPSKDCAKFCYACGGNYLYPNVLVKSELMDVLANRDPVRMAKLIVNSFKRPEHAGIHWRNEAMRMFDTGDGTKAWAAVIQEMNKQGVRAHVFSKDVAFLQSLDERNIRLLSIDRSNLALAEGNKLPISFVMEGTDDISALKKYKNRIDVILPVMKRGQHQLTPEQIKKVPKQLQPKLCPIDSGQAVLPKAAQKLGVKEWTCKNCDAAGLGVGCYHNNRTKTHHFDDVRGVQHDTRQLISRIEQSKNLSGKDKKDIIEKIRNEVSKVLFSKNGPKATGNEKGIQIGALDRVITNFIDKYKGAAPVKFVVANHPSEFNLESDAKAAFFDGGSDNSVVLMFADQIENAEDAIQALEHEIVAHYGFRQLLGKEYDSLLADLYNKRESLAFKKVWAQVLKKYPTEKNQHRLAEEMIAQVTEADYKNTAWRTVIDKIQKMLRAVGLMSRELNYNDIVNMVRDSQENLKNNTQYNQGKAPVEKGGLMAADEPVFYSQMLDVLVDKLPAKGTAANMKRAIQQMAKSGKFKAEEMEWLGVNEWLDEQEGRVKKEDVINFIRDNQVEIIEKQLTAGEVEQEQSVLSKVEEIKTFLRSEGIDIEFRNGIPERIKYKMQDSAVEKRWEEMSKKLEAFAKKNGLEFKSADKMLADLRERPELSRPESYGNTEIPAMTDWLTTYIRKWEDVAALRTMNLHQVDNLFKDEEYVDKFNSYFHSDVAGDVEELAELADKMQSGLEDQDAIHPEYVLPGGKYYKELLLKLPTGNENLIFSGKLTTNYIGDMESVLSDMSNAGMEALDYGRIEGGEDIGPDSGGVRAYNDSYIEFDNFTYDEHQALMKIVNRHGSVKVDEKQRQLRKFRFDDATFYEQPGGTYTDTKDGQNYDLSFDNLEEIQDQIDMDDMPREGTHGAGFYSDHWNDANVLVHTRFNTREVDGKKVLFLEEVQSDWHQAGRDGGYETSIKDDADFKELEQLHFSIPFAERESEKYKDDVKRKDELWDIVYKRYSISDDKALDDFIRETRESVKDAPFKKAWPLLIMKRMIRYAAENGFDSIAWTTGAQQNERWNLANFVNKLEWSRDDKGMYNIKADITEGNGRGISKYDMTEADLAAHVGKEVANRIIFEADEKQADGEVNNIEDRVAEGYNGKWYFETETGYMRILPDATNKEEAVKDAVVGSNLTAASTMISGSLEGEEFRVGGQGMIGFYDKMLPSMVNKYVKKWGAKTSSISLPNDVYGSGKRFETPDGDYYYLAPTGKVGESDKGIEYSEERFETLAEFLEYYPGSEVVDDPGYPVHSLDITPKMKAAAKKAQPLFAKKESGDGRTDAELDAAAGEGMPENLKRQSPLHQIELPQTETPAFKAWFKDSKVVDKFGKPMVVYHGTAESFDIFNIEDTYEQASYFTANKETANAFAVEQGEGDSLNVMPTYLSIQNPIVLSANEIMESHDPLGKIEKVFSEARIKGHDGAILKDVVEFGGNSDQYVAFHQEQIKSSVGNKGTFDPNDPRIHYSMSSPAELASEVEMSLQEQASQFKDLAVSAGKTRRKTMLKMMTGRQIVDFYSDIFGKVVAMNPLINHAKILQEMQTLRENQMHVADREVIEPWEKLNRAEEKVVSEMMLDSTYYETHPDADFESKLNIKAAKKKKTKLTFEAGRLKRKLLSRPGEGLAEDTRRLKSVEGQLKSLDKKIAFENERWNIYPKLKERYNSMNPAQMKVYQAARDSLTDQYDRMQAELEKRIDRAIKNDKARRAAKDKIKIMFSKVLEKGPYFPMSRFGDFVVTAMDKEGQYVREHAESDFEQKQIMGLMEKAGYTNIVQSKTTDAKKSEFEGAPEFANEIFVMLDENGIQDMELKDDIYQLVLRTMPGMSFAKHSIHRRKIAGYNRDMKRAFASSMMHGWHHISRIATSDKMVSSLEEAQKLIEDTKTGENPTMKKEEIPVAQDVVNHLQDRLDLILNPKGSPWTATAGSVGFTFYLGMSPAAGLVNLTQTWLVSYPKLAARFGWKRAGEALLKSSADFIGSPFEATTHESWKSLSRSEKISKDEREFIQSMIDNGTIDVTQSHWIAALADTDTRYHKEMRTWQKKSMRYISAMFHNAEVMNREATLLAAYRLAQGNDVNGEAIADPAEWAQRVTYRTHFDYSSANRAQIMKGDIMKVVTMFKNYSQHMIEMLISNAYKTYEIGKAEGLGKAWESEFRRTLTGTLGMHALAAGTLGMPMMSMVFSLLNLAFDDEDEPWDASTEYQIWAYETFGPIGGEAFTKGLVNAATGADLHSRVSLNDLLFRDDQRDKEGRNKATYYLEQAAGPMFGLVANMMQGITDMGRGEYGRGFERTVPKFVRDYAKAARYAQEGVLTYSDEAVVEEITPSEAFLQAMGLSPAVVGLAYDQRNAIKNTEKRYRNRRKQLMNAYYLAIKARDLPARAAALKEIDAYNAVHKDNRKVRITRKQLKQSVKSKRGSARRTKGGTYLPKRYEFLRDELKFTED